MNKAFVREPEETGARNCPRCGSHGVSVGRATLEAHLSADALRQLAESAWYCPFAKCAVAYFDEFDRHVEADLLERPMYPKDPDAPLCNCFGLSIADVDADLVEGTPVRVRQLIEKSRSELADCERASPDGRCCVPNVQRYYMRMRSEA